MRGVFARKNGYVDKTYPYVLKLSFRAFREIRCFAIAQHDICGLSEQREGPFASLTAAQKNCQDDIKNCQSDTGNLSGGHRKNISILLVFR